MRSNEPADTSGSGIPVPPMRPNLMKKSEAATLVQRDAKTIENWIGHGYITGYRASDRSIYVDRDELEKELKKNPKMRDGRKVYGSRARIVALPKRIYAIEGDK